MKTKENHSSYRLPLTATLQGLSLMIGLLGTELIIAFETKNTPENNDSPNRVLYALTLFFAVLLFQAAKLSAQSSQDIPSHSILSLSTVDKKPPLDLKEKILTTPSENGDIPLIELKSVPLQEKQDLEIEPYVEDIPENVISTQPSTESSSTRWHSRSRWSSSLAFLYDLMPMTWRVQASVC
jgi:hypothetical protein